MKQDNRNIASDLIESTVKVVARDGFDKASTRNIAGECGIADAYIYVHYKDKDDLLSKAFKKVDTALAEVVKKHLPILSQAGLTNEDCLYFLFSKTWMHLIAYPESCRFFVLYYYSPYYPKYSAQAHLKLWTPILGQIKVLFRLDVDVRNLLRPVLNTMLTQAIKAATDTSTHEDVIARNTYDLIRGMLRISLADR